MKKVMMKERKERNKNTKKEKEKKMKEKKELCVYCPLLSPAPQHPHRPLVSQIFARPFNFGQATPLYVHKHKLQNISARHCLHCTNNPVCAMYQGMQSTKLMYPYFSWSETKPQWLPHQIVFFFSKPITKPLSSRKYSTSPSYWYPCRIWKISKARWDFFIRITPVMLLPLYQIVSSVSWVTLKLPSQKNYFEDKK